MFFLVLSFLTYHGAFNISRSIIACVFFIFEMCHFATIVDDFIIEEDKFCITLLVSDVLDTRSSIRFLFWVG